MVRVGDAPPRLLALLPDERERVFFKRTTPARSIVEWVRSIALVMLISTDPYQRHTDFQSTSTQDLQLGF